MPKINAREIISKYMGKYGCTLVQKFIDGDMNFDEFNKYCGLEHSLFYQNSDILTALYITFAEGGKRLCLPTAKVQKYASDIGESYRRVDPGFTFTQSFIKCEEVDRYGLLPDKVQNHPKLQGLIKAMYLADQLIDPATSSVSLSKEIRGTLPSKDFTGQVQNIPKEYYEDFVERLKLTLIFNQEDLDENFYERWEQVKTILPQDLVNEVIDQIEQIKALDVRGKKIQQAMDDLCKEEEALEDIEAISVLEAEIIHCLHGLNPTPLRLTIGQHNDFIANKGNTAKETNEDDKANKDRIALLTFHREVYSEFEEITNAIDALLNNKTLEANTKEACLDCLVTKAGYYFSRIAPDDVVTVMISSTEVVKNIERLVNSTLDKSARENMMLIYEKYLKGNSTVVSGIQYFATKQSITNEELTQKNKLLEQKLAKQQEQLTAQQEELAELREEMALQREEMGGKIAMLFDKLSALLSHETNNDVQSHDLDYNTAVMLEKGVTTTGNCSGDEGMDMCS